MEEVEKKILKSKHHNGVLWNKYQVKVLPIKDIWISVPKTEVLRGKSFFKNLTEDIKKNGLFFPLLVAAPTRGEVKKKKKQFKERMMPLPNWEDGLPDTTKLWVVWGGSQRIRAAADMGYTHIDCAIIPSLDEARTLQGKMRKPYQGKLY